MSRRGLDASDRLYPHPAPPPMSAKPVQPGYSFQAVDRAGYPRFPVQQPKTRSPRRRLITSQPGVVHKTASAYDTFQPAPLDGVGSPRWVTPQSSSGTLPPPNAPVAPMPSFRSEEARPPPNSVANHWGCTVLVGSVQNSWQPVDHQLWGKKLHSDASDPESHNAIFRPAGDGGARSIPKEMVWLHSGSYRYTGIENDLVRHVPEPRDHGLKPGMQLVGSQKMRTPRSRAGVRVGSARNLVVLPKLDSGREMGVAPADTAWIAKVLEFHNGARAAHGACPLVWSEECFQLATAQAKQCTQDRLMTHGHLEGVSGRHGQNAFMVPPGGLTTAEEAIATWYEEVEDYPWDEPGFAGNTGHFSQLVWGDTESVGMALSPDGKFIIANYYPAGNVYVPGEFERNVLPTPDNPNELQLERLAHLTPRAVPSRREDRMEDYLGKAAGPSGMHHLI